MATKKAVPKPRKRVTNDGEEFRQSIYELLKTRYDRVEKEVRRGSKMVDIYFIRRELGEDNRWAVESKDYGRPLTKLDLVGIMSDYEAPYEDGKIDGVLVVAKLHMGAEAQAYVEARKRRLRFRTYAQLEEELFGLSSYIMSLANLFKESDLNKYYIEARLEERTSTALEFVESWMKQKGSTSLAILGSYGQGKSSFARRLASSQASRAASDPTERIPILVQLGQVSYETELEALFGKLFTSQYKAEGYRFDTLQLLNARGRLLFIFDGFDEMKHAMSWADFRANFLQINRLAVSNSKIIILGRPQALTEENKELIFRGMRKMGGKVVEDKEWPPWQEEHISFFSKPETEQFFRGYLGQLDVARIPGLDEAAKRIWIENRCNDLLSLDIQDLTSRPVQARMLAMLAADPTVTLRQFGRRDLYSEFAKSQIRRETEKRSRRPISEEDRLSFLQRLAWWSWLRDSITQGAFYREEMPDNLLMNLSEGEATDTIAKMSEYLIGAPVDQKQGGIIYFSHRSFQEFLVAERLRDIPAPTPSQFVEISRALTEDVRSFLFEGAAPDVIVKWVRLLDTAASPLSRDTFIGALARDDNAVRVCAEGFSVRKTSVYGLALLHNAYLAGKHKLLPPHWLELLFLALATGDIGQASMAGLALLESTGADGLKSIRNTECLLLSGLLYRLREGNSEDAELNREQKFWRMHLQKTFRVRNNTKISSPVVSVDEKSGEVSYNAEFLVNVFAGYLVGERNYFPTPFPLGVRLSNRSNNKVSKELLSKAIPSDKTLSLLIKAGHYGGGIDRTAFVAINYHC